MDYALTYTERTVPANDISERSFRVVAVALLALAFALRVLGARGDLSMDEITSIALARKAARFDHIFWNIGFDNNHILNTVWLRLVGSDASPFAIRACSILLGVATVAAFGAWGKRRSRATGLIAMALAATAYLLVNYGSEARGYSGLALCIVLAALTVEDILNGRNDRLRLCIIMLAGFLFHMYMAMTGVALSMAFAWTIWKKTGSSAVSFDRTMSTFVPPAFVLGVAFLPVILRHFAYGLILPFTWPEFVHAYGDAAGTSLAVPGIGDAVWYMGFALVAPITWFALHPTEFRAALYLSMIVIVPLALACGDMPNIIFPRYLMIVGVGLVMMCADMIGSAQSYNSGIRYAAGGLLAIFLFGDGLQLAKFFHYTRGHYQDAVAAMTAAGPTTFTVDKLRTIPVVVYNSRKLGRSAVVTPRDGWCDAPSEWLIVDNTSAATAKPRVLFGPKACPTLYGDPVDYPAWGLTSLEWLVYHRQPR